MGKTYGSVVVCLLVALTGAASEAAHYYADGQVIPLTEDTARLQFQLQPSADSNAVLAAIAALPEVAAVLDEIVYSGGFIACSLNTTYTLGQAISAVSAVTGIRDVEPCYRTERDEPALVCESFLVRWEPSVLKSAVDDLVAMYDLELTGQAQFDSSVCFYRPQNPLSVRVLDVANTLDERPETRGQRPI